ncbi:MAG: hypothetical protein ACLQUY_16645 [Ktedonobacterales bacterium]
MQQIAANDSLIDEVSKLMLAELTWRSNRIQRKVETLLENDERRRLLSAMFAHWNLELEQVEQALDLKSRSDRP